ncbi:MAG: hypothetical protein QME79_07835 [Bacillota bacterium]|nr:hypothetical protein [Bacillota bacterium]
MAAFSGLQGQALPLFLGRGTAALLTAAPPAPAGAAHAAQPGEASTEGLDDLARRLWEELLHRLDSGETRLYEEDLAASLSIASTALSPAFQALRLAGLVDWEGPYLYLHPRCSPVPAPDSSPEVAAEDLAEVYQAIQEVTGKTFSSAQEDRIREWLAVLGLQDVLDEIKLCRQRGPCRLNQVTFALDRACNRRRRISPFGPLDGHGVLPAPAGGASALQPGQATAPAASPTANAGAYEPVSPEIIETWVAAHPDLYAGSPPGPPPAPPHESRPASWASAYEPVPPEVVRRWAEAFAAEYEEFRREYRRLAERAKGKPSRRRSPRLP